MEWMKIKRQVQYFIVALIVSALLVGVGLYYHQQYEEKWKRSKYTLVQAKARYQQALDREQLLSAYESQFEQLERRGIYGDEHRIQWIETIQKSTEQRRIPSVKFDISRRTAVDRDNIQLELDDLEIYASKMKLDFQLLHEGDLFGLLKDLNSRAEGLSLISNCRIKNNFRSMDVLDNNSRFNFIGECELLWLTLDEQNQQGDMEDDS